MKHSNTPGIILEKFRLIDEQMEGIEEEVNSLPFGSTLKRHLYGYCDDIGGLIDSCKDIIENDDGD